MWTTLALIAALGASPAGPRPLPEGWLFGVTVDSVESPKAVAASLGGFARRPVTRVVFDAGTDPDDYAEALETFRPVTYVMGQVLDSSEMKDVGLAAFDARTKRFVDALWGQVDVWEVGNEVNGDWLGEPDDVVAKVESAARTVRAKGGATALTLYYDEGCAATPGNEMFTWVDAHLPPASRSLYDYVLVSYYEDDCDGRRPDWEPVFERLAAEFPRAKVGFGEVGTKDPGRKVEVMQRYYSLRLAAPRFIGGFFWWYGRQDLVPKTTPYWRALDDLVKAWP